MNEHIIQQRLFEVLSEATMIDISEEGGLERLNGFMESIYTHTNLLNATASRIVRNVIDTNWETYKNLVQETVPESEHGDNPKQLERDRTKIIYNLRLQFKDETLALISDVMSEYEVL